MFYSELISVKKQEGGAAKFMFIICRREIYDTRYEYDCILIIVMFVFPLLFRKIIQLVIVISELLYVFVHVPATYGLLVHVLTSCTGSTWLGFSPKGTKLETHSSIGDALG